MMKSIEVFCTVGFAMVKGTFDRIQLSDLVEISIGFVQILAWKWVGLGRSRNENEYLFRNFFRNFFLSSVIISLTMVSVKMGWLGQILSCQLIFYSYLTKHSKNTNVMWHYCLSHTANRKSFTCTSKVLIFVCNLSRNLANLMSDLYIKVRRGRGIAGISVFLLFQKVGKYTRKRKEDILRRPSLLPVLQKIAN